MKLLAVFNDGTVSELKSLTSEIQIVHNSADVSNDSVDIYINDVKAITGLAFRKGTAFMPMNAMVPQVVKVAPKGSANSSAAFATKTLVLDSGANYYAIAMGVKTPGQYLANPNAKSIQFDVQTYKGARKVANNSKNVDLLYSHGATDLQATTMSGLGQVQFLSKNDAYGDFHGYAIHSAQDDIRYDVMDAAEDTLLTTVFGDLATHQGKAGLVFASGFKTTGGGANQNGASLRFFIIWPDGDVDSLVYPYDGLNEQLISGAKVDLYPNPAKDNVSVSFELTSQESIVYEMLDITGKVIMSQTREGIRGKNGLNINTATLNNGIYFINVKVKDQSITRKIAIAH
jgi:hypothetical protein